MKNQTITLSEIQPGHFRVVRIIARLNVGGPAQHVAHLTAGLAHSHPTLLVFGSVADGEAEMISQLGTMPHMRIAELGRAIRPGSDLVAFFKLVRVLRRARPEIVHTHTAKAGTLGRLAAFAAGVPVRFHTYHGHVFEGYFNKIFTWLVILLERALARVTTRIIAISESQARDLTTRFRICRPDKMDVIPLGLDLARFVVPRDEGFKEEINARGKRVITSVGRLEAVKNHKLLISAFAKLDRRNVILAIVGDGTLRDSLAGYARDRGVAERVRFVGWRDDLSRVYAASDLIALSSVNEGTPVCLLESLAAGVPIVATNVGGVRDVVGDAQSARLVPANDVEAFAFAIAEMLDRPFSSMIMQKSRERVVERYSIDRLLRDVAERYDQVTARRNCLTAPANYSLPGLHA